MKIARRYLILQRVVWVQSLLTCLLAGYVLVSHKKSYPLNITVEESKPVDLSFLDLITNRLDHTASPAAPLAPVAGGVSDEPVRPARLRMPFKFDRYMSVNGRSGVVVGGRALFVGDYVHGLMIESASPLGVIVAGEFYNYRENTKPIGDTVL